MYSPRTPTNGLNAERDSLNEQLAALQTERNGLGAELDGLNAALAESRQSLGNEQQSVAALTEHYLEERFGGAGSEAGELELRALRAALRTG